MRTLTSTAFVSPDGVAGSPGELRPEPPLRPDMADFAALKDLPEHVVPTTLAR